MEHVAALDTELKWFQRTMKKQAGDLSKDLFLLSPFRFNIVLFALFERGRDFMESTLIVRQ